MNRFCIVPDCERPGRHTITLRCRRPDTSAIWAPATAAYLCDGHATGGAELEIIYRPLTDRKLRTIVIAESGENRGRKHERVSEITQNARRLYRD